MPGHEDKHQRAQAANLGEKNTQSADFGKVYDNQGKKELFKTGFPIYVGGHKTRGANKQPSNGTNRQRAQQNRDEASPMKFFIDSADVEEIGELADTGLIDGVTTNPSLIAKSGRNFLDVVKEICSIIEGPVSAEVTALDAPTMIEEGQKLAGLAENITIKVPLTWDGLKACKALSDQGTMVNVTLCFNANQALLAAKAGATFISPFIGRLDDIGLDGMELISEIRTIYDNYDNLETEILAASIRSVNHVKEAALIGADVATVPGKVIKELAKHPLTDKGLEAFLKDWAATGQTIL